MSKANAINNNNNPSQQEPQKTTTTTIMPSPGAVSTSGIAVKQNDDVPQFAETKRPTTVGLEDQTVMFNKVKVETNQQTASFALLEDDYHIEQMIQELIHYGSIELCSTSAF